MNPYLELARPWQWYKNLVVFLALFFSGSLLSLHALFVSILAFLALSLVSSGMYAINDVFDAERDKKHPKKKHRPIPSGRVAKTSAVFFGIILLFLGLLLAYSINLLTFLLVLFLPLNTLLYTLFFKRIPFLDVADLSINFLIRTLVGVYAINVPLSYWIIIIPYFLALYLALLKRYGELKRESKSRRIISFYNEDVLSILSAGAMFALLILYTLYLQSAPHITHRIITTVLTLPLATFILFHWYGEAIRDPDLAEDASRLVYDKMFIVMLLLWALVLFGSIYLPYPITTLLS